MTHSSPWRVNDTVAYGLMRAESGILSRLLLTSIRDDDPFAHDARRELMEVRRDAACVDGYDRHAVDALSARFRSRSAELAGGSLV